MFRIQNDHYNVCVNSIFIGEVFQIEVSDGLVHPLGTRQNVNLYPAVVIAGARVFRSLYALELKRIKLMSVQNGICTSEVF